MASYDEVIPPGGTGHVEATLDTLKLHGAVGRAVTVYTDDPAHPSFLLTVRANVVGGISVFPQAMLRISNRAPAFDRRSVLIRREPGETETVEIDGITTSVPWLRASAEKLEASRPASAGLPSGFPGDWVVSVDVADSAPFGRYSERLKFSTGLAREPEIEIPVMVDLQPPVHLSVDELALPSPSAGVPAQAIVLLSLRRDLDPRGLKVEANPDSLDVKLEPAGRRGYKVHVTWKGSDAPHGEVVFSVGDESLRLPVVAAADPS